MIPMTLSEVAEVVDGHLADAPDAGRLVTGAAFLDTRTAEPDGLFVAVAGQHVDGHDFAASAVAAGAAVVLGARATGVPTVVVDDVEAALAALARHVLDQLPDVTVLAITGSQGKTGTKDYLAAILGGVAPTVATFGNHNNEWGVPLTVLNLEQDTRYLVVEMGARGVGHIAHLTDIAPPDIAAVLNVGTAHVGEFGSRELIAVAKAEIVEALGIDGTAVLNADDPAVATMAARTEARVVGFGAGAGRAEVRHDEVRHDEVTYDEVTYDEVTYDNLGRPQFVLRAGDEQAAVTLDQLGGHQVLNATAAAAMALAAGLTVSRVAAALNAGGPASAMRMELHERADGLVVVNDAYNANPDSVVAALESLARINRPGRRCAVLGEMRELGDSHEAAHRAIGQRAAELGIDVLIAVGEPGPLLAQGARSVPGWAGEAIVTASRDDAALWLGENVCGDDVVLVKASRGVALEHVVHALLPEGTHTR